MIQALQLGDAAKYLGISGNKLNSQAMKGRIPYYVYEEGKIFDIKDLDEWRLANAPSPRLREMKYKKIVLQSCWRGRSSRPEHKMRGTIRIGMDGLTGDRHKRKRGREAANPSTP